MPPARTTGALLMAGAALQLLLFFAGVTRRSYLALALPVTAAMLAQTALTFWLGWTMATMGEEPDAAAPAPPIP
jgi:hypothetical protein